MTCLFWMASRGCHPAVSRDVDAGVAIENEMPSETAPVDTTEATASDKRELRPEVLPAVAPTPPALNNSSAPLTEFDLMAQLRRAKDQNPAMALELARAGNRRFPNTPDAPERASAIVHALSQLGRASESRGEAEDMVNRYPDSSWVREIEGFSGAHRHRNVRVNDAGLLEYE